MRFGSVSPDDDTVSAVLAERAEHFLEEAALRLVMAVDDEIRSLAEANREAFRRVARVEGLPGGDGRCCRSDARGDWTPSCFIKCWSRWPRRSGGRGRSAAPLR
ncbi:hypothetical protein ACFV23_30035 [Streptomyces sp. NPDC059627]